MNTLPTAEEFQNILNWLEDRIPHHLLGREYDELVNGRDEALAREGRDLGDLPNFHSNEHHLSPSQMERIIKEMWTREDQEKALGQGWGIFDSGTDRCPKFELERIDDPGGCGLSYDEPKFESDDAAAAFVKEKSDHGNELAGRAVAFLNAVGSRDVKRFRWDS